MYEERLKQITKSMLELNPFYAHGFPVAWQDDETGQIWAQNQTGDRRAVFPADNLGEYFYFRPLGPTSLIDDRRFLESGCTRSGMLANVSIRLVSVTQDSAPDKLLARLLAVLASKDVQLVPTAAQWNRELVTAGELSINEDADMLSVTLQRLKKETIVSIDFTLLTDINFTKLKLDCLPDICKTC